MGIKSQILFLLSIVYSLLGYGQQTSFYISAHQDDWQLFMNPNVYKSIKNEDEKTVIIHLTAGDAGHGISNNDYYKAREEGSLRAIRFISNSFSSGIDKLETWETVKINKKKILRYSYDGNIVYLLRLPDGNGTGEGYPIHNNKSLEKLYKKEVINLHSIDSTANYKTKTDLIKTLSKLVQKESKNSKIQINLANTNLADQPEDHSDHRTSSLFFQEVAKQIGGLELRLYLNYKTSTLPKNIIEEDFINNIGAWGATTSGIGESGHPSTWDTIHNEWLSRQYYKSYFLP